MNDRILSETEHDAAMGRLARGEPDTWTPLVDHDTALRERLDANAALVDDLFRRLADTERAADTNAARVGELSVRLADTEAERDALQASLTEVDLVWVPRIADAEARAERVEAALRTVEEARRYAQRCVGSLPLEMGEHFERRQAEAASAARAALGEQEGGER